MDFESSQPQEEDFSYDADLVFALAALPGCQPGQTGWVFAARNSGLYHSEDGGQNWSNALEQIGLSEPLPVTCLAIVNLVDGRSEVFAGAPGCLFRSADGGQTWRLIALPTPPPTVSALAISPNYEEDETLLAGTVEDGIFISRDGGRSFVTWNFGLLDLNIMCLAVSPNYRQDETIFAGTETGIFRSTNGGRAWRDVDLPFGYDAVLSLALTPDFAFGGGGQVYAGTENHGLWISADGGDQWERLAEAQMADPVNAILTGSGPMACSVTVLCAAGIFYQAGQADGWQNLLPEVDEERQPVAILDTPGFPPGPTLVSFSDGTFEIL